MKAGSSNGAITDSLTTQKDAFLGGPSQPVYTLSVAQHCPLLLKEGTMARRFAVSQHSVSVRRTWRRYHWTGQGTRSGEAGRRRTTTQQQGLLSAFLCKEEKENHRRSATNLSSAGQCTCFCFSAQWMKNWSHPLIKQPTNTESVPKHLLYTLKIKFNWYHRKSLRHRHYPTYLSLQPIETEIQRRKKKSNLVQALLPLVTYCIFAFHFISEPIHHSRLGQDEGFVIFTMLPFPHVIWASNNNNAPNKHQDECRCIRINPIKKIPMQLSQHDTGRARPTLSSW